MIKSNKTNRKQGTERRRRKELSSRIISSLTHSVIIGYRLVSPQREGKQIICVWCTCSTDWVKLLDCAHTHTQHTVQYLTSLSPIHYHKIKWACVTRTDCVCALPGWGWNQGPVSSVQGERVQGQGLLRSSVARNIAGLHSRAVAL
jgi:hypothetical protein